MNDTIRTYRVRVPTELSAGGVHPEVVVSATTPERAKRKAWAATRWPDAVRAAADLDAIVAEPIVPPSLAKPRPEG